MRLREAGHEADHVEDVGMRAGSDSTIWAHALNTGAIIVTKDEDFAARFVQSSSPPVVLWLRVGNTTNPALHAWIGSRLPGIVRLLDQGARLIEVI